MNSHAVLVAGVVVVGNVAGIAWFAWAFRRTRTLLDRWAAANGCRIVERRWRVWRIGPYLFRSGEAQWVFRLAVVDAAGHRREGYARLGGFFLGLVTDAVDVTWDDDR